MTINLVIAQAHECVVVNTLGHEMNEIPKVDVVEKMECVVSFLKEIGLACNICRCWVGLFICVIVFDFSRAQLQNNYDYTVSIFS